MLTWQEYYDGLSNDKEQGIALWVRDYVADKFSFQADRNMVLEIGSGWGIYSGALMRCTDDEVLLHTIDSRTNLPQFEERTAGYEHRINRITADSKNILPDLPSDFYEMIFIDGNHEYEGFKRDFELSWPLLKEHGWIVIDDVLHKYNFDKDYGIIKAMSELAFQYDFKFTIYPVASGIAVVQKIPK